MMFLFGKENRTSLHRCNKVKKKPSQDWRICILGERDQSSLTFMVMERRLENWPLHPGLVVPQKVMLTLCWVTELTPRKEGCRSNSATEDFGETLTPCCPTKHIWLLK